MSLVTRTPYVAGTTITASAVNTNENTIFNDYNGNVTNANIASGAAIADSKLATISTAGKVSGAAFTSLSSIPSGAGIIPAANLPGGSVPGNYRSQMYVMQASTTTIIVAPGVLDVGGTAITKTANTTLTITTAGNWAGGASLQATNTTGYVGVDISGNIMMHTTAPTNADYAELVTAANNTKRYVTWSSVVYRVIGWFQMNATGSGQLDTFGVSNLADGAVRNIVHFQTGASSTGTTTVSVADSIPTNTAGDQYMSQVFVPTNVNSRLLITIIVSGATSSAAYFNTSLYQDATSAALVTCQGQQPGNNNFLQSVNFTWDMKAGTTSLTTFKVRCGGTGGTMTFNGASGSRLFGGALASSIRVEEIEAQLN